MFEVGKKYVHPNTPGVIYECLAVSDKGAMLIGDWAGACAFATFSILRDYRSLPPEPKRWSTWQNVYSKRCGEAEYNSRGDADNWASPVLLRVALIRRYFEQHEGKEAVCVNVELEKV